MTDATQQTGAKDDVEEVITKTINEAAKQMRNAASEDYKKTLGKKLEKLDYPDWLSKTTFFVSNGFIATLALVAGCIISPKDGISPADHQKALKDQGQEYTKTIDELKKTHDNEKANLTAANTNLQRQLTGVIQRTAPGSNDAFDIWATAAVRTSQDGKLAFAAPFAYLATLDRQGRNQLFNDIARNGHVKFGLSNTLAFYANKAAATDPSLYPNKVVVIPLDLMTSAERIAALEEAFSSVSVDIASKYAASQTPVGYRLDMIAGGTEGRGVVTATRDVHMDKRNTAADDMVTVATHNIR